MAEENPFARLFRRPATSARLAVLRPGPRSAPIDVELQNKDPTSSKYDCISYDRSYASSTIDIKVDGQSTAIPGPLESALRALRREDQSRTVFADLLAGRSEVDSGERRQCCRLAWAW